jgi:hypothetical protein
LVPAIDALNALRAIRAPYVLAVNNHPAHIHFRLLTATAGPPVSLYGNHETQGIEEDISPVRIEMRSNRVREVVAYTSEA